LSGGSHSVTVLYYGKAFKSEFVDRAHHFVTRDSALERWCALVRGGDGVLCGGVFVFCLAGAGSSLRDTARGVIANQPHDSAIPSGYRPTAVAGPFNRAMTSVSDIGEGRSSKPWTNRNSRGPAGAASADNS
jgi:hypothetical protein